MSNLTDCISFINEDIKGIKDNLSKALDRGDVSAHNRWLQALRDALMLKKEYDWNMKYSTDNRQISVWEEDSENNIRNKRTWDITRETKLFIPSEIMYTSVSSTDEYVIFSDYNELYGEHKTMLMLHFRHDLDNEDKVEELYNSYVTLTINDENVLRFKISQIRTQWIDITPFMCIGSGNLVKINVEFDGEVKVHARLNTTIYK